LADPSTGKINTIWKETAQRFTDIFFKFWIARLLKMIVEKQMECRLAEETEVLGENLPQRVY
jgi:hypothetical protein